MVDICLFPMTSYPMMSESTDIERLEEIGGKAYILETILDKWSKAPIPKFKIYPEISDVRKKGLYRASSILDVLGGFGLTDSVFVDYPNDALVAACLVVDPRSDFYNYAHSIGVEAPRPTLMVQEYNAPVAWALMMEHPNNRNILVINYNDVPTGEIRTSEGKRMHLRTTPHTAYYDGNIHKISSMNKDDDHMINGWVETYFKLRDLNIISTEWIGIAELGWDYGTSELYQWTPIRKRNPANVSISPLIFGSMEKVSLPYISMTFHSIDWGRYMDDPKHELNAFAIKEAAGDSGMLGAMKNNTRLFIQSYIDHLDKTYPDGYIIADNFWTNENIPFDITMKNAKVAILNTTRRSLELLNHDISRLIYKAPCLMVGDIDMPSVKNHSLVEFSCDGENYSCRRVK